MAKVTAKKRKGKGSKDYFGLGKVVSVVLAILPPTALVCGFLTRLKEGKVLAAVLRVVLGWNIIWIADLVCMILKGRIVRILNV